MNTLTNLVYILSVFFHSLALFIPAVVLFALPGFLFIKFLWLRGIRAKFWTLPMPQCLFFESYTNVWKFAFTALASIPFVVINLPFMIPTFFIGYVLYSLKALSITRVYNHWIYLYSGVNVAHDLIVDQTKQPTHATIFDKHVLNASIFEQIFFECVPLLVLQIINNLSVFGTSSAYGYAYLPVVLSGINVITGIYSLCYYRLYKKVKILDIPVKVSVMNYVLLDLDGDCNIKLDASCDSAPDNEPGIRLKDINLSSDIKSSVSSFDLQRISSLEERMTLLEESNKKLRII